MSAGYVHVKASMILAAGFSLAAIVSLDVRILECVAGAVAGTIITPDWDVDKTFIGNRIVKKKLGQFAERIFDTFLSPYKKSFKHGRFASHFPIYSTWARLLYIFFFLILPFYVIYSLILFSFNYYLDLRQEFEWWIRIMFVSLYTVGLMASDTIHFFLDILTKESR